MKSIKISAFLHCCSICLCLLVTQNLYTQDISGIWQGILSQSDCISSGNGLVSFAFSVNLDQNGNVLTGTARSVLLSSITNSQ